jgi:hypothetical protein
VSITLVASLAIHAAIVLFAVAISSRAPAQEPEGDLIDVDMEPAKGVVQGEVRGTGTPPREIAHARTAQRAPASRDPVADTNDEDAFFRTTKRHRTPEEKQAVKDQKDQEDADRERAELRAAVEKAMLAPKDAPPGPVAGTGDAQPKGTPDGAGAGKKGGLGSSYKSMLNAWFSSRFVLRGSNLSWEELKLLSATASISVSPDRKVLGFSVSSPSGNAAYDAAVNAAMKGAVGATLPEPPDGEDVPGSITLRFRCRSQSQCS